jgi:tetratricopeptide (TPR) repeat protein
MSGAPRKEFKRPTTGDGFEALALALFRREWQDSNARLFGRSGQEQYGVDLYGVDHVSDKGLTGVQCKKHGSARDLRDKALKDELLSEVDKAKGFPQPLRHYIFAHTGQRSTFLQEEALRLTAEHAKARLFSVDVMGWEDFEDLLVLHDDIRTWYEEEVQAAPRAPRLDIGRLPVAGPLLIGRETEMARLDAAWDDPATHVLVLVAFGGMGKSALVSHWMDHMAADGWRDARRVLDWSFYSQGTEERVISADRFLDYALAFYGDPDLQAGSPHERGQRLAGLVRQEKTLLVLDGIEPLQHPPGPLAGRLKDPGLAALLRSLAAANPGLCVVTTRERIADLNGFSTSAPQEPLESLSQEAGARLLRELGVRGRESELRTAAKEFGNHALTLTLLGTYLKDVCRGDVRRRGEVPILDEVADETGHARRVIASYVDALELPEVEVLRLIGLFDRTARPEHIKALRAEPPIADLTETIGSSREERFRKAVARLRRARLLADGEEELDAHPLVRVYFQKHLETDLPEAWRAGNLRLYEHLQAEAPDLPNSLEDMEPLFTAVLHGCRAGRQQEVFREIYRRRIQREEAFNWTVLGAFGSNLTALAGFFDHLWDEPSASLDKADQAFVLNEAGMSLRALGRLTEAVQPMRKALEGCIDREDWTNAAKDATNLIELTLTLGEVERAVAYGKQGVDLAERSGDTFMKMVGWTMLAETLHQKGHLEESAGAFREAEVLQMELQPEYPRLYSLPGYRYCNLLLSRGESREGAGSDWLARGPEAARRFREMCLEVRERAEEMLKWSKENNAALLTFALGHLILGRSYFGLALTAAVLGEGAEASFALAAEHVNHAVEGLRHAGQEDYLPNGLLARSALRRFRNDLAGAEADLSEALEIAVRGSMRLFECDAHLEWAQLYRQQGEREAAERHLKVARQIVKETGYGRRAQEVGLDLPRPGNPG